jgi:hypothetical protein
MPWVMSLISGKQQPNNESEPPKGGFLLEVIIMIPGYKMNLRGPMERATLPTRARPMIQNMGQDKAHLSGEVDALDACPKCE